MSVINQVLLDLEKRRASGSERGTLHNHVRAMPPSKGGARGPWIAGLVVAALALAAAWAALQSSRTVPPPPARGIAPAPAIAQPAAPLVPEVVTVSSAPERAVAARLTFELSRLPDPLPEPGVKLIDERAIPATRIVGTPAQEARAVPVRAEPVSASRVEAKLPVLPAPATRDSSPVRKASAAPAALRIEIDKRVREPTPQQRAEAEYRSATALLHKGQPAEARAGFEAALAHYPGHPGARQGLLGVLVESGRTDEAERVMQEGLQIAPYQIGFAMALARLQVDRGDTPAAVDTLQASLPHAQGNGDYFAFLAGLLQRERRFAEAIEQFHSALRLRPDNGVWLLGLGMSLQALDRNAEAREAFQRARGSPALSPDLQAFADQRLRQLK